MRDGHAPQLLARLIEAAQPPALALGDAQRRELIRVGWRAESIDIELGEAIAVDGEDGHHPPVVAGDPALLPAVVVPRGDDAADVEAEEVLHVERERAIEVHHRGAGLDRFVSAQFNGVGVPARRRQGTGHGLGPAAAHGVFSGANGQL